MADFRTSLCPNTCSMWTLVLCSAIFLDGCEEGRIILPIGPVPEYIITVDEPVVTDSQTAIIDDDNGEVNDSADDCYIDSAKIQGEGCGYRESEADTDGDGTFDCNDECVNDANENASDLCGCADTDTDGILNGCDIYPTGADSSDSDSDTVPDACDICSGFDDSIDTDQDGTPDGCDACPIHPGKIQDGSCGCGTSEVDTDGDGTFDCNDECVNDANKSAAGVCGCGVADTDTDGDGASYCISSSNDLTGAPYDLTSFEADMVLTFDDNGIARPEWPMPPLYDDTPCNVMAGNEDSLNYCLDLSGKHIVIPAGDYVGPFTVDGNDQWLEMSNGATMHGGLVTGRDNSRIKITGGNIVAGSVWVLGTDDLLFDNVNFELVRPGARDGLTTCGNGTTCTRVAIINSTCIATTACTLTTPAPLGATSSLIIANFDAWSRFDHGTPGNAEFVSRLQNTDRVMVIDSHFRVYPTAKPAQRFHYGSTATLVANNVFETSGTGFTSLWIDTTAGAGEEDDIDNMFILRNSFYAHHPTKPVDVIIDDSIAGNGIDVILVHVEDNVSYHIDTASFTFGGNWDSVGQDCGGREPCLRNINNTGQTVQGLTLVPFTAGADH
jgi:hypothetical protein